MPANPLLGSNPPQPCRKSNPSIILVYNRGSSCFYGVGGRVSIRARLVGGMGQ